MLELKKNEGLLYDHQSKWDDIANTTIKDLKKIFGDTALDIQHIGSTAICNIKAKPIIDIAIGVKSLNKLTDTLIQLESSIKYRQSHNRFSNDLLFVCENDGKRTHQIHILLYESKQWHNYIDFRNYMNTFPLIAKEYESIKIKLAEEYENQSQNYTNGKQEYMSKTLCDARIYALMKDKIDIAHFELIDKGWSSDKKYHIKTRDNKSLLLRISDICDVKRKKNEYRMLEIAASTEVLMSRPIEFGFLDNKKYVYQLLMWIDGVDVQDAIINMTDSERYVVGYKAGKLLKTLHSIPAPNNLSSWIYIFSKKIDYRVKQLGENNISSPKLDLLKEYLYKNIELLSNRVQYFNHGDFSITNLILSPSGQVGIIDFNAFTSIYGDPYWEFCTIPYGHKADSNYYSGMFNGYFGDKIPDDFFPLLAFYFAYDAFASVCEMIGNDESDIHDARHHVDNILRWFNNMQSNIPTWYITP